MNPHDDHLPPAWLERGNNYHWEDLTENELALEELGERPSRHPSSPGGRSPSSSRAEERP